jgi:hypothetical protein
VVSNHSRESVFCTLFFSPHPRSAELFGGKLPFIVAFFSVTTAKLERARGQNHTSSNYAVLGLPCPRGTPPEILKDIKLSLTPIISPYNELSLRPLYCTMPPKNECKAMLMYAPPWQLLSASPGQSGKKAET